ncbi:MAG TPA: hypothetical protein VGS20_06685 [Candidatus Acidoferrales bacterium]|nr:hypothetical protein [Candidatus Acidoferrales bacterium]
MIPGSIKREHILAALAEINHHGIPLGRDSTKFKLIYDGRKYPPKYVISLAGRQANGAEIPPDSFGGGNEANKFLSERGFSIVGVGSASSALSVGRGGLRKPTARNRRIVPSPSHNERCSDCKVAVERLLAAIYGQVEKNYRIEAGTSPANYKDTPLYSVLSDIYRTLQEHRGHKDFVRSAALPTCDFWIPNPGFVVEFDESQHFTECRALTLQKYPHDIPFGFDREKWLRLCNSILAEDHDPAFRDEQRAWYDTLRDFVPHLRGLHSTLRLFASEFPWCSLNPDTARDAETFRQILGERANFWTLEFGGDEPFVLGRVVIDGAWRGDVASARTLLTDVCSRWPKGKRVQCLTTCGAFLRFDWPSSITPQLDNRFPDEQAMKILESEGRKCCDALLEDALLRKLRNCTDFLTLGVDTYKDKISSTQARIPEPHAELVYVVNLATRAYHFTAKSYPTPGQEKGLLRNGNLENHFVGLDGKPPMVLGCHDLTLFNPRSDAKATGWRQRVKEEFKRLAAKQQPTWVLHHPHTTIKIRTWLAAWAALQRSLPSVDKYAGSGAYSKKDMGWDTRDSLKEVLAATKSKGVMDIVVHMAQP